MTTPAVSIVVATHERPNALLVTLASLRVQTFAAFECIVMHELELGREDMIAASEAVVAGLRDERFSFHVYPERKNDWGATVKGFATRSLVASGIVGQVNGDNYYCPMYLEAMSAPILAGAADMTYCDWISHYGHYSKVRVAEPAVDAFAVEWGGWLCRTEIAAKADYGVSDGEFEQQLIAAPCRHVKVPHILWVHN